MIERTKYLNQLINTKNNGFPKVITGIRRCGKSYLLKYIYTKYLKEEYHVSDGVFVLPFDPVYKINRNKEPTKSRSEFCKNSYVSLVSGNRICLKECKFSLHLLYI
ncbi:MAG: AAA family ATPase [Bacilli bacterium]|nr:AAA family ATPase [Bacilli bacterium]